MHRLAFSRSKFTTVHHPFPSLVAGEGEGEGKFHVHHSHLHLSLQRRARRLFGAASCITVTGKNFATVLALNRFHHSPTCYCSLLDRVKDQALKSDSIDTDNCMAHSHHVCIDKLLSVYMQ